MKTSSKPMPDRRKTMKNTIPFACLILLGSLGSTYPAQAQELGLEYRLNTEYLGYRDADPVDLDGDGDLDLIVGDATTAQIYWAEHIEGGVFRGLRAVAKVDGLHMFESVVGADMDGDGDQDVLVAAAADSLPSGIGWYENVGGHEFPVLHRVLGGLGTASLAHMADMDGDGLMDLVYCRSRIDPVWQKNFGNGQFGGVRLLADLGTSLCQNLRVQDLNGDGVVDVIWTTGMASEVGWVPGLGAGAFGAPQMVDLAGSSAVDFDLADLDGDGDPDLVYADQEGGRVAWNENVGSGFGGVQTLLFGVAGANQLAASDLDGDGDVDLVVCGGPAVGLSWVENRGAVGWGAAQRIGDGQGGYRGLHIRDMDWDGDPDPIGVSDQIHWHKNLGGGEFGVSVQVGVSLTRGVAVDFDGDGDLDLLGSDSASSMVLLAENRFGGAFLAPPEPLLSVDHHEVAALDLDLDGDMDLAVARYESTTSELVLQWMRNDQGQFSFYGDLFREPSFNGSSISLAVEHMDGDAFPDLVAMTREQTATGYGWYSAGTPLTGEFAFYELDPLVTRIVPADLDGDGLGDLVLQNRGFSAPTLSVRLQLPNGDLGSAQGVGSYPSLQNGSWSVADMNSDGNLDLVVTRSMIPFGVDVLLNDGAGMFPTTWQLDTDNLHFRTEVMDLDFDGDQDIALLRHSQVDWFENLGDGNFQGVELLYEFSIQETELDIFDADLNGDGAPEWIKRTVSGLKIQFSQARFGDVYCQPVAENSTGQPAIIQAQGSPVAMANDLILGVGGLPQNQAGYFLVSTAAGLVPMAGGYQGSLCLGGAIGRMNRRLGEVFFSGTSGMASVPIDLTRLPIPGGSGPVQAGETRYFQAWYRDVNPGATSNFTGGLRIRFE